MAPSTKSQSLELSRECVLGQTSDVRDGAHYGLGCGRPLRPKPNMRFTLSGLPLTL
jgi:hypothetical protein